MGESASPTLQRPRARRSRWFIAVLLGFPFFYWYQLGWVVLTSALLYAVYRLLK
jgi:hypothetical protein